MKRILAGAALLTVMTAGTSVLAETTLGENWQLFGPDGVMLQPAAQSPALDTTRELRQSERGVTGPVCYRDCPDTHEDRDRQIWWR